MPPKPHTIRIAFHVLPAGSGLAETCSPPPLFPSTDMNTDVPSSMSLDIGFYKKYYIDTEAPLSLFLLSFIHC